MQRWLLVLLGALALLLSSQARAENAPKNIILVIGDGMGYPYLSAYRYFKDGRGETQQADMQPTLFDQYLVGAASTYPADSTLVTDSAAGATTLASGIKTYNGAIGVDAEREPVTSMMEIAKNNGYLTAAVATTRITHATPAAFFTHVESRRQEKEIARQYAEPRPDGQLKFDLLIGSGRRHFRFENDAGERVDYLADLTRHGARVVESTEGLQSQYRLPVVALLHEDSFPYVIDDQPRLKTLTQEALRLIEADGRPYVLMIEASMIDWCGHARDIACAMHEVADLEAALEYLVAHVEGRDDTALVVTADHSTGGFTMGADGQYQFRAALLHEIQRSLYVMSRALTNMPRIDWDAYISHAIPYPLSTAQQAELNRVASLTATDKTDQIHELLVNIVRFHTGSGFTTTGHTGEDVPVIAAGPWREAFRGQQDHSDIAKQLIEWIK
ncbi:alkaline phosphatase [Aliidiomarina celeris]|uniref:alkaline phosphatase n=1 Tax=Aliidiomarina celeris TaxID=2249428 RepID=UPI000DE9706F|nr:alkaline phosphatase [Aliidiomarina celeris]